jgi:hypothetical protein
MSYQYYYDGNGRLVNIEGENYRLHISYDSSTVTMATTTAGATWTTTIVFKPNKRIDYSISDGPYESLKFIYVYDSSGFPIQEYEVNSKWEPHYFTWSDGDLLLDSSASAVMRYHYYPTQLSQYRDPSIGFVAYGPGPSTSKHLLTFVFSSITKDSVLYRYEFDAQNKIVADTFIDGSAGSSYRTYKYECF